MNKLPRTEVEIMKYIWERKGQVPGKEISTYMEEQFNWKAGSTLKTLSRLVDKEFLSLDKRGKYTFYTPLVSEEEYVEFETEDFFSFIHRKSLKSIISTLDQSKNISDKDIEDLEEWLRNR